jgi:hypothetical protein
LPNKQGVGYEVQGNKKVSHLFYIDDLKLFFRDETRVTAGVGHCQNIIDNMRMEFGPEKCVTAVFKHGKLPKSQNIILNNQRVIQNMKLQQTHKNMGIKESDGNDNSQIKDKLVKEYYHRVRQIPNTELNSKNTTQLSTP